MGKAVGVNDGMEKMSIIMKLKIRPLFNIIRILHCRTHRIATVVTFVVVLLLLLLVVQGNLSLTSPSASSYYEMVSFFAHRMPTPTNDSALVAVDGSSGAGDVLLDDVQGKNGGRVARMPDPERDL